MRDRLCRTFRYISQKVWDWLIDSQYYGLYQTSRSNISRGIGMGEETITDLVLLEISKRQPSDVITVKFGRNYEFQEGADWEWWFLSKSGIIGLRLQAKRIHSFNGLYEYTHLDYRSGNSFQVDVLINNAQRKELTPLYILYNFWDLDFSFYNFINHGLRNLACCKVYSRSSRRNFGITIASAFAIRDLVHQNPPGKKLLDILPVSWPIYCLTCCGFSDLSESVSSFLNEYVLMHEPDFKVKIYESLPEEVFLRLKGDFDELAPTYTSFILDLEHPHDEIYKIKEVI